MANYAMHFKSQIKEHSILVMSFLWLFGGLWKLISSAWTAWFLVSLLTLTVLIQATNSYEIKRLLSTSGSVYTLLMDRKEACEENLPRDLQCRLEIQAVIEPSKLPEKAIQPSGDIEIVRPATELPRI